MHAFLLAYLCCIGLIHLAAQCIAGTLSRDPDKFTIHGVLASGAIACFIWSA